ncbi:hypothetical protein CHARACLAT_021919 [Characodon lateralis]|uniref:palmitoyl-protein hydrolase n=1 Tax=Characodon lateralis TaxID=208331 RepID=A0ABU7D0C8_9TELE|nr:hypothetical protein [Characodon lateralis]
MAQNNSSFSVKLYIYDLSRGMARQLSPVMLGRQLDGIWHTGVVVHGKEFFFGGAGINHCPPVRITSIISAKSGVYFIASISVEMCMFVCLSLALYWATRTRWWTWAPLR